MKKIVNLKTEDIIQVEDKNFHYEYIIRENDDGIIFIQTLKTRMPKPITPGHPKEPRTSKLDLILKRLDTVDNRFDKIEHRLDTVDAFIKEQRKFNAEQREFNKYIDNKLNNVITKNNLKV